MVTCTIYKMGGAVDMGEGRDTTQWDLEKRGKWAYGNLMMFNKYNEKSFS